MGKHNNQADTLQFFKKLMRVYSTGTPEEADAEAEAEAIYRIHLGLARPDTKGRVELAIRRAAQGAPQRIVDGGCQKLSKFTPPTFDEMAAYMDAEMARLGIPQPGAAA